MLQNIIISDGILTPAYSQDVYNYQIDVGKQIASTNITVIFEDSDVVTINGSQAISGEPVVLQLVVGNNNVVITVDGMSENYGITVIRLSSSDREIELMRGAWRKLDGMPYAFGLPHYNDDIDSAIVIKHFGGDLKDVMRTLRITNLDNVPEMSLAEMHIENRIVYYALRRFRNSSSVYFKFSTATDGKSVDKSMIPKMLNQILAEYDDEWSSWRATSNGSALWTLAGSVRTTGEIASSGQAPT